MSRQLAKSVIISHGGRHGSARGTYIKGTALPRNAERYVPAHAIRTVDPEPGTQRPQGQVKRVVVDDRCGYGKPVTAAMPTSDEDETIAVVEDLDTPDVEEAAEETETVAEDAADESSSEDSEDEEPEVDVPENRSAVMKLNKPGLIELADHLVIDYNPKSNKATLQELIFEELSL